MEFRKIIKFGNSSHVISVPKYWLEKNNLNKGDVIYFTENSNNELILFPEKKEGKLESKEITIETNNKSVEEIQREITASYINNFSVINIIGKDLEKKAKEIKEKLHNLMALEIVEETGSSIITKDFLNIKKISIENIIRKMDIIIRVMLSDSKSASNKDLYESVYNRDENVNRLTFLVYRVIKYLLDNPNVSKIRPQKLLSYWLLVDCLEKTADESKRIARSLKETKLKKREVRDLMKIYSKIEESYLSMMNAYYKNDKKSAYKLAVIKKDLIDECNQYIKKYHKKAEACSLIDRFKILIHHIRTIGRIIYD